MAERERRTFRCGFPCDFQDVAPNPHGSPHCHGLVIFRSRAGQDQRSASTRQFLETLDRVAVFHDTLVVHHRITRLHGVDADSFQLGDRLRRPVIVDVLELQSVAVSLDREPSRQLDALGRSRRFRIVPVFQNSHPFADHGRGRRFLGQGRHDAYKHAAQQKDGDSGHLPGSFVIVIAPTRS